MNFKEMSNAVEDARRTQRALQQQSESLAKLLKGNGMGNELYTLHDDPIPLTDSTVLYEKLENQCKHLSTTRHRDYVQCNDCGSVLFDVPVSRDVYLRKWFKSLAHARLFKEHGRGFE